eukprot:GDKK01026615.1.p1 GENE.GDKK01026615.1~~GDKK01026615.1.p1  ORF type:complete len:319 (+),score=47.89 GDKK01026615.1:94-1050(+)
MKLVAKLLASMLIHGYYFSHLNEEDKDQKKSVAEHPAAIILDALKKPGDAEAQALAKTLPIVSTPFYGPQRIRCLNQQYQKSPPPSQQHAHSVLEVARLTTNGETGRLTVDPFTPSILRTYLLPAFLPLYAAQVPEVSIEDFIEHLMTHFGCGVEGFIMAFCMLAKLPPNYIPVCDRSIHRMILTSLVLSCKVLSDQRVAMRVFASIGGVSKSDMIAMEWAFLTGLGFDASISTAMYVDMIFSLRQHCSTLSHHGKQPWAADAWRGVIEILPVPSSSLLTNELRAAQLMGQSESPAKPLPLKTVEYVTEPEERSTIVA